MRQVDEGHLQRHDVLWRHVRPGPSSKFQRLCGSNSNKGFKNLSLQSQEKSSTQLCRVGTVFRCMSDPGPPNTQVSINPSSNIQPEGIATSWRIHQPDNAGNLVRENVKEFYVLGYPGRILPEN